MPNCVQFIKKGSVDAVKLNDLDAEICTHFNVPVHPTRWYHGWFDYIGFTLSMGNDVYVEIESMMKSDIDYWTRMLEIFEFIKERYTWRAWAER